MERKRQVFVAEDHTILREGLKSILASHPDLEIIGEGSDGMEAIQGVGKYKPDLILLDLSMPRVSGLESIKEIKKISPKTKILVLTIHDTEEYILPALQAGANGYLLKYATQDELFEGIQNVLEGKSFLAPEISEKVIQGFVEGNTPLKARSSWDTLTKQERRILKLIAEGYKNKDVADYLCISDKTAAKHRANLMHKLDLHSIQALTTFAIKKGLVEG